MIQKTCTILLILAVLLNLLILGIRTHSLFQQGVLTTTTGTEGSVVYGVWKVRHDKPLYEGLNLVLNNTLYNFMYYQTAGLVGKALNVDGDQLMLSARLTTTVFSILGALVGLITVIRLRLFRNRTDIIWAASALALFWFGTSPMGWWRFTARPDLGAVCFTSLGLLCFLTFLETGTVGILLLSSVSFFLAWSFKQSIIFTFLGTLLVTLACRRNLRTLVALIGPITVGILSALYIGGADYRFNIVTLPALGILNLRNAAVAVVKTPVENPLLFITPFLALAVLLLASPKSAGAGKWPASLNFQVGVLGTIFLCTFAGGAFLCLRGGSDINYFFEAGAVASIAVLPSAIMLFNWNSSASGLFFSLTSAVLCLFGLFQLSVFMAPTLQVTIPDRLAFLRTSTFGRLNLLTAQQQNERAELSNLIAMAPKPVLIIDDIFSQPWHSTNGAYPAFVIDPNVLGNLHLRGVVKDDRVATLIQSRRFQTVVVSDPDEIATARQGGYDFVTSGPDGLQEFRLNSIALPAAKL